LVAAKALAADLALLACRVRGGVAAGAGLGVAGVHGASHVVLALRVAAAARGCAAACGRIAHLPLFAAFVDRQVLAARGGAGILGAGMVVRTVFVGVADRGGHAAGTGLTDQLALAALIEGLTLTEPIGPATVQGALDGVIALRAAGAGDPCPIHRCP